MRRFSALPVALIATPALAHGGHEGALGSWRVYAADGETPARRMISIVSLMACALFALAIVLPFIASLVIPRCWE